MPAASSGSSAIALVASWFVAVIFTPYLGVKLLPNIKIQSKSRSARDLRDPHLPRAARVIQWCVNHRVKIVLATAAVFVVSIAAFGHVQQQFFPLSERPELFLQLRLPEGTAISVTENR